MQKFTDIRAMQAQAQQQMAMQQAAAQKEINDLMNATMSRCFAAFIAQGQNIPDALVAAQHATQQFGLAIGILKEKKNDDSGQDNSGSADGSRIIVD